jgi:glycosyltransferase involved in cell wall biosynthesis
MIHAVEKLSKRGDKYMKILILTDKMGVGGAETHIAMFAKTLTERGEQIYVASSGGSAADRLEELGIVQIRLPLSTRSPIRWLILRRRIRAFIKGEGIDVAHAHARVPALLIHGVRRLGCAEIVTVHAKFKAGLLRRLLSRWGEHSIAVSEDLRTYLHDVYKIPMQRITVIPNGIDLSHFSPKEEKRAAGTLRILFASRLDADCSLGAELLCEIAPRLAKHAPKLAITIVGGGKKMAEIAERAQKINNVLGFSCISHCGTVQDMAPLLKEQDIFVGVSRAALEAAACGCSVVLCGNEGYGGILKGENFFEASLSNFCARGSQRADAETLLRDILELSGSPELRDQNATLCRQLLEEWYDSACVCQKTVDVYRKSLHDIPRATVAIGGYFGCGNLGDDAILQAFIEYTRTHYPNMRIFALTKHPFRDARRFGVQCFHRKNPLSVTAAFLRADAFLCGGGSLLQNVTGKLSLY